MPRYYNQYGFSASQILHDFVGSANKAGERNIGDFEIYAPIYAFKGSEHCFSCHKETKVYGFAAHDKNGKFHFLPFLSKVPDEFRIWLESHPRKFKYRYSKQGEHSYFMNTCEFCGAPQGDNYLYYVRGHAFYDLTSHDILKKRIATKLLKKTGSITVQCNLKDDDRL